MQLKSLITAITPRQILGPLERDVESIAYDSRRVQKNTLFVALKGEKSDGHQFIGQAIVPTGTTFAGTTIGGLSSITYDPSRNVYYTLSDDQSQVNPARFYTVSVDVGPSFDASDVHFDSLNKQLGAFAHELRNPLAPIRNAVQLLHNGDEIFPPMLAAIPTQSVETSGLMNCMVS